MIRLPLAALLGTVLALRPRRRGTPERQPAVVQTQIILAVVGALIMLVVGASLARAFGIVGAANLIRYRSKIDDPKDAVVMLCALAVGLASGVGLYGSGDSARVFIVLLPVDHRGLRAADARLRAERSRWARRPPSAAAEDRGSAAPLQGPLRAAHRRGRHVSYMVTTPKSLRTDRVSNALDGARARDQGRGRVERKTERQDPEVTP